MSKFESELRKITYLMCDKEDHLSEPLSRICIDAKCSKRTLVCSMCEAVKHQGHETLPLKIYLTKIYGEGKASDNQYTTPLFYSKKIDEIKQSFFSSISEHRSEVLQMLNTLETQGRMFFNKIEQQILLLIRLEKPLEVMKRENISQKKIKQYFYEMTKLVSINDQQKFSLQKKLEQAVANCKEKEKKLVETLNKSKKQLEGAVAKISASLDSEIIFAVQNPVFVWSTKYRGHKVVIKDVIAEQTGMESSGQRFTMMEPSLNSFGPGKKLTWGIKVIKFVGWVGIGICLRNSIIKANYHFNYNNIGHGSYLISSNGYSWSHSIKQFNSAFKTFQFNVNDIIYMEYDPSEKKLRFKKNTTGDVFTLDVVDPPMDDEYHPCANICSSGDTVEVINPGIDLS